VIILKDDGEMKKLQRTGRKMKLKLREKIVGLVEKYSSSPCTWHINKENTLVITLKSGALLVQASHFYEECIHTSSYKRK